MRIRFHKVSTKSSVGLLICRVLSSAQLPTSREQQKYVTGANIENNLLPLTCIKQFCEHNQKF